VGEDRFLDGIKTYCKRHEFANAELSDFLAALEEASGRDLRAWSKEWLETEGVNTLRPAISEEDGRFASFAVEQSAPPDHPVLRRHRVAVGLYETVGERLSLRRRVELDVAGEHTAVPDLVGEPVPDLVLVNDGDLTFAKIRLDERSLATAVDRLGGLDDSLARTLCWTACWDMTRDGEMRARDYLRLVVRNIEGESKIGVAQTLLAQAASAINIYGHPANRVAGMDTLAEASLDGLRAAGPGTDEQLAWARSFIATARSEDHVTMVRGLLDGSERFEGLAVDTELRWHVVRALAAAGAGGEELIAAEQRIDPTDRGTRHAAACRAARPDSLAKAEAWRTIVEDTSQPLALIEEMMGGFHQFGQGELLAPYADRYFEALSGVWETKDLPDALAFARRMYPHLVIERRTVESTDAYLGRGSLPAPIRRLLLEGKDGIVRAIRARAADFQ
jgi:aminopeptidase N